MTGKLQKRAVTDDYTSIQANNSGESSCLFVSNSPIWPYSSAEGKDNLIVFLNLMLINVCPHHEY